MLLWINLCKTRGCKYYGVNSTYSGTGIQNLRRVDFPSLTYFRLTDSWNNLEVEQMIITSDEI